MSSIGHRSCKKTMKKKTPLLHNCVCFQMPEIGFRPEVSFILKYFSEKLPLSQINTLLQRELFPTSFISTALLCLLEVGFLLINIYFEYLPKVSSAFNQDYMHWSSAGKNKPAWYFFWDNRHDNITFCYFFGLQAWVANFERPRMSSASLMTSPTGLGPYLRFGCLSPRLFYWRLTELYRKVQTVKD